MQVNGGCWEGGLGASSDPQPLVPIRTAVAFGWLPLLDAWIGCLEPNPHSGGLVAMVIEFT